MIRLHYWLLNLARANEHVRPACSCIIYVYFS